MRKNAKSLSKEDQERYADAASKLTTEKSKWNDDFTYREQFAAWHRAAFACDLMSAHVGPAFFPRHRMFLFLFERAQQKFSADITVPYWDWTVDNKRDGYLWQDHFVGKNGDQEDDEHPRENRTVRQ